MPDSIDFSSLPHQSKLFVDFLRGQPAITSRFPSTPSSGKTADRALVTQAIEDSMHSVELLPIQRQALELFREGATTIVTGQQIGFLGGPLYTLFKIQTAIQYSKEINNQQVNAVPVFWLEDNDHDAKEAGTAAVLAKELGVYDVIAADNVETASRQPVSYRHFDESISERISNMLAVVPETPHKNEVENLLRRIYTPGRAWNDAFLMFLQEIFGAEGLLILKASEARRAGLMAEIVRHEVEHPGLLERLVIEATDILSANAYHVQAKPSPLNLFLHVDHQRHKINNVPGEAQNYTAGSLLYAHNELQRKVSASPQCFSPGVLLRPLVQDYILGTHSYVAGPGEIAYIAQLKEVYAAYQVAMPMMIPRVSATLLPRRVVRFLEKQALEMSYFLRPWQEVEKETLLMLHGSENIEKIEQAKAEIQTTIEGVKAVLKSVDPSLEATVGAASRAVEKEFENITKKLNAALKRRAEQSFSKYREAAASIFPNAILQERYISPIFLLGEIGVKGTRTLLLQLASASRTQHHIVELGAESEESVKITDK